MIVLFAEAQGSSGGSGYTSLLFIVGIFALIYFMMIRPQQRRRREVQSMQSTMGVGDEIITVGGLYGTIRSLDEESVLLEIAPGVTARYAKAAIGKVNQKAVTDDAVEDEAAGDPADETPAPGSTPKSLD
ncbi:preprotein translocase subunit YajC [Dactylosporangium aurantiacum]|uniref:Preprotein translocase subunit YajC n=1 Tax=Dactylosporangium aurantiacum TaxID=35754 RepID=A0A9Q9MKJ3_9ACTN|nr:preprotein translocase subunit YajC [Dactylosporangium aurantiacum]MDG6102860.1 preprotein translocase subunit YajC [Dactylosporangium aurantiacum]UWZ52902.1 preprotein translocase subunit YajC [Dactylosporangium aurantiacum]